MKLYKLRKLAEKYDTYEGFVVLADNENRARILASQVVDHFTQEDADVWMDANLTTCTEVSILDDEGVVMGAFLYA